jgi:hypothetical protein
MARRVDHGDRWTDSELEIRSLVCAAVRLAVQLERNRCFRRERNPLALSSREHAGELVIDLKTSFGLSPT